MNIVKSIDEQVDERLTSIFNNVSVNLCTKKRHETIHICEFVLKVMISFFFLVDRTGQPIGYFKDKLIFSSFMMLFM